MSQNRLTARTLFFLLLAPLAAPALEPPDWVRDAPGTAEFPREEAICLRRHVSIELKPDGRSLRRVFTAVKVLRPIPFGRTGLADPRVHYDAEAQEIRVLQARTWLPSGRALDTDQSGKNVVFPDALAQTPDLARFRDLVVTHLGIQEGCVALFEYEIEDLRPPAWPFEGALETQMSIPTLELLVSLSAPEEAGLLAGQLGPAARRLALESATAQGQTRLTFSGASLPAAQSKSDLLVYGTRSWPQLAELLAERQRSMGPLPEALAGLLRQAATDADTPLARADAVSRILEEGLTPVQWPSELLQLQTRPAERIWHSTYATTLEAACLLASGLELAGLEEVSLHPVLRRPALGVPCLALADEFWVSAALPGEPPLWIQAGRRPGAPEESALAGASILLGQAPLHAGGAGSGSLTLTGNLEVDKEGQIRGSVLAILEGTALGGVQAALEGLEPQLLSIARSLGATGLDDVRIRRLSRAGASARFSMKGAKLEPGPDGFSLLNFSALPGSPLTLAGLHLAEQTRAIQVPGGPRTESLDLTLKLPAGWRLVAGPQSRKVENDLGRMECSWEPEEGGLRLRYELKLESGRVEPEQWSLLCALLAPLRAPAAWTVLLGTEKTQQSP